MQEYTSRVAETAIEADIVVRCPPQNRQSRLKYRVMPHGKELEATVHHTGESV